MAMPMDTKYPNNKAGVLCSQRTSSVGRRTSTQTTTTTTRTKVQSIGQLIQQQMDSNWRPNWDDTLADQQCRIGANGEAAGEGRIGGGARGAQQRHQQSNTAGHGGTVQLVDPNNNAVARQNICCWTDKGNCIGGGERGNGTVDADDDTGGSGVDAQNQFRCCAVCGGRIWQGITANQKDKRSAILGECHQQHLLKLDGGEELLVHSACFRCATCGLDLLGEGEEVEQQVVKRADRFYCALHGQQQLLKQQQQQQPQCQKANLVTNGNGNFGMASKGRPQLIDHKKVVSNCATAAAARVANKQEQNNYNADKKEDNTTNVGYKVQKWWERRTEEFNGDKGFTSTFRYYGNNNGSTTSGNNSKQPSPQQRQLVKGPPPVPPPKQQLLSAPNATDYHHKTNNSGGSAATRQNSGALAGQRGGGGGEVVNNNKNNINGRSSSFVVAGRRKDWVGTSSSSSSSVNNKSPAEDRCEQCGIELSGTFVLAKGRRWCSEHFVCANSACARRLLDCGFVEESQSRKNYCPICYECLIAPMCHKCSLPLTETCLNALGEKWHNECFTCAKCRKPFGTMSFFVEDGKPYCEDDWNLLFTTKCSKCLTPIKVGQKWLEALGGRHFHADCFECAACGIGLEGKTYFERDQQPFCRVHATAASAAI